MPSEWFECTLEVPADHSEAVGNFLIESGAPGLQTDDVDAVARLTAYFSTAPPIAALLRFCASIGCALTNEDVAVRRVPAEDWAENWKAHFQPQAVGARLFICPPWAQTPPLGRVAVVIDPGMAFGTGQHATTHGCLVLLEQAVTNRPVSRALDIGTGSGVLAIALVKLGVPEVWAVDNDPNACAIAKTNAVANGVDAAVHVGSGVDAVTGSFDLIAANLFANLLEEMAPRVLGLLRPGGIFICSGFLAADEPRVRRAYEAREMRFVGRHEEQSWATLALQQSREG